MKLIDSIGTLLTFQPWGKAIKMKQEILDQHKLTEFDKLIETLYPNGLTHEELNALLSDRDLIVDALFMMKDEDFDN